MIRNLLSAADIDYVGFYDQPLLKFDRLLETYLAFAPRGLRSSRPPGRREGRLPLPEKITSSMPDARMFL